MCSSDLPEPGVGARRAGRTATDRRAPLRRTHDLHPGADPGGPGPVRGQPGADLAGARAQQSVRTGTVDPSPRATGAHAAFYARMRRDFMGFSLGRVGGPPSPYARRVPGPRKHRKYGRATTIRNAHEKMCGPADVRTFWGARDRTRHTDLGGRRSPAGRLRAPSPILSTPRSPCAARRSPSPRWALPPEA